ncbi:ADP-ribosylglycohydrolase family protein [Dechloromonas sp. H13]|uniref:ADP-ribosylglycohydrolase family protein n=1 Tax=Dechloromonas sp. H13 TaxID=2570193 RepID=UPI001D189608|nr:ADP-ribosylglycohydrolase family protein [Dechloromonas sp. H13]
MKQTSQTDTLRIDSIQVNSLGGKIGMTLCPGKQVISSVSGEWARDLDADLAVIGEWGATALLSLIEPHEFENLGVARMKQGLPAGITHYILPIVDGAVPSGTWERAWANIGPQVRERLALGERIVIHCRGGLGRTGMVAARLLVEFGEVPATAMRRVRAARPGAIENRRQEEYVLRQKPLESILPRPQYPVDPLLLSRYRGCLLGGAVGDALGAPVEFMDVTAILKQFGAAGIRDFVPYANKLGAITDDTQMTLFTAEGLLRSANRARLSGGDPDFQTGVAQAYQRWLVTQGDKSRLTPDVQSGWLIRHGPLFARRAPGITCLTTLCKMVRHDEQARNDSKGCGGVMRMAPVGLFVSGKEEAATDHAQTAFDLGCQLAGITHGHPAGQHAAGVLAVLIVRVIQGASLPAALDEARTILKTRNDHEETLAAINLAVRLVEDSGDCDNHLRQLGQGWVAEEALAIAIYCALRSNSFEEGVRLAVNLTGDSDSTGAIAGNLLGALYGVEAIPPRWLEPLELREVITAVADDLLSWPQWTIGDRRPDDPARLGEWAYWVDRYPGNLVGGFRRNPER